MIAPYKAIIVDDDPWTLVDIRSCFPFASNGFNIVAECASYESALPLIIEHHPELVITDIRMEQHSGLDLIRECRKQGLKSLFIILSGYDSFSYAKEAIELGALHYMLKPINDSEARQVMQRVVDYLALLAPDINDPDDTADSFQRLLYYLDAHSDKSITLDDLSRTFFLNKTYICDLFRRRTGKTFTEYLAGLRISRACHLLAHTNLSVGMVAQRVGFDDTRYFARIFKSVTNQTPRSYRDKNTVKETSADPA